MKDNFKFTLYEVFGYFLPGIVFAFALVILFWSAFLTNCSLGVLTWQISEREWFLIIVGCYMLGHIDQAVGNILFKGNEEEVLIKDKDPCKRILLEAADRKVARATGAKSPLSPKWLYRYMDEYVIQHGAVGDRDIFVYREGFYRGLAVALGMAAVSILIRLFLGNANLALPHSVYTVNRIQLAALVGFVSVSSYLSARRFRRFSEYRAVRVLMAFVTTEDREPVQKAEEEY